MCGRTRCTLTDADIEAAVLGPAPAGEQAAQQAAAAAAAARPSSPPHQHPPRARLAWPDRSRYTPLHNAGPTRITPAVTAVSSGGGGDTLPTIITVESMVWGVPRGGRAGSTSSPPPSSSSSAILINGRAETAFATPTWARALAAGPSGRAVVLANGYYEWKRPVSPSSAAAQPHYIFRADGVPLALAALAAPPPPPPTGSGGESAATSGTLRRYAVLTTSPPKSLAWLHDRAPLLLPTPAAVAAWLDPAAPPTPSSLAALASPAAVEAWPALAAHPVKLEVGNVRYQAPDCSVDVRARKGSLGSLFAAAAAKGSPGAKTAGVKEEEGKQEGEQQGQARKKQKRTLDGFLKKGGGG